MRKITKVIVLWQIYKILGLEVNNYFLNLFIKDIIKSGMVRKKICYAWIEVHEDISKIKREKNNLHNICCCLILFHYHYFRIQYKTIKFLKL